MAHTTRMFSPLCSSTWFSFSFDFRVISCVNGTDIRSQSTKNKSKYHVTSHLKSTKDLHSYHPSFSYNSINWKKPVKNDIPWSVAKKSASMGESGYNGRSDDCHTPREIQTLYRSTKEFLNKRARCVHQAVKLNLQSTVLAEIDHDSVMFWKFITKCYEFGNVYR